ncbi:hypothetical protein [uncultured Microbacterium sp.]|uniref:hypothetical protein n=1 Tax=uncultured Microbacterium sp. TaxID=191216 RepID=UPI0025956559|nr:hypothetical protein [uncultured Microbacterium sp.]
MSTSSPTATASAPADSSVRRRIRRRRRRFSAFPLVPVLRCLGVLVRLAAGLFLAGRRFALDAGAAFMT